MSAAPKAYDLRDNQERAEVAEILSELAPDHLARKAFAEGARTAELVRLVNDRPDLVERLKRAFLAGWHRILDSETDVPPA